MANKKIDFEFLTNQLSRIIHIVPLIGAYLVVYGALKFNGYYGYFGISIVEFVSFSELILYFITDIEGVIILILFWAFRAQSSNDMVEIARNKIERIDRNTSKIDELNEGEDYNLENQNRLIVDNIKQDKQLKTLAITAISITLFYVGFIIYVAWESYGKGFYEYIYLLIGYFVFYFLAIKFIGSKIAHELILISSLLLLMLALAFFTAKDRAREVVNGGGNKVGVFLENQSLTNDSTSFYVGKTQSSVFIYNKKSKSVDVYNVSNISKISIKPK